MSLRITLAGLLFMCGLAAAADYAEGQVWTYKTRPGDEKSTVLINKVETHARLGKIFHITIAGAHIKSRRMARSVPLALPHVPVSEATLNASLIKLVGMQAPDPRYMESYKTWKGAADAGRAGIYTIPVADILGGIEERINNR